MAGRTGITKDKETAADSDSSELVTELKAAVEEAVGGPAVSTSGTREMTLATLVHLLGLPTAQQLSAVENKIDLLLAKLGSITARIELLERQKESGGENAISRIDFQLTEIKAILKKVGAQFNAGGGIAKHAAAADAISSRILTSEPPVKTDTAADPAAAAAAGESTVEPDVELPPAAVKSDQQAQEEFQRSEAIRVRKEVAGSN